MRSTIRRIGLTVLLVSAACAVLAAGLPSQYANTPTVKQYPQADVLVLSESHNYDLMPDGRVTEKVRRVEKILTYQGMDEAGDPKIAFDKENQTLTIDRCRTYTTEGKVVDAKANSFNEMTPFALEKAPAYTAWRQMVVTKVGLDINCVVELEYTLADKKPWRRFLEGVEVFRDSDPYLDRSVSITVPQGMDLRHHFFNAKVEPEVKREAETQTYTWTLRDVPLARTGHTSSLERSFLPTLVFTTCPDWGHHSTIIGGLVAKAEAAASDRLKKKTDELLKGKREAFEKVVSLHDYVAENINNVHWPLWAFQFTPRSAGDIYDSGYGNALDKAVLLCAMLKQAGFDCAIAAGVRSAAGAVDPAVVPCMAQMDTVVVRVEMGDTPLWLDPDAKLSERSQRDFAGLEGLPLLPGFAELHTMTPVAKSDLLWAKLDLTVSPDLSMKGSGLVTLAGNYSPFYEVQGDADAQKTSLEKFIGSVLQGSQVDEVTVVRMEPSRCVFDVRFTVTAPKKEAGLLAISTGLPAASVLSEHGFMASSERDLPLVLSAAGDEHLILRFQFGDKLKPTFVPKGVKVERPAGSLTQEWTLKDGVLTMDMTIAVPSRVVSPGDYAGFREIYGLANSSAQRTVLFD